MTHHNGSDHGHDDDLQDADTSSENTAADAGSESPEEGEEAMAAAEDATTD